MMKLTSEINFHNMEKSLVYTEYRMKVVLSPSFAMESQALTKHTAMNALKEL
jgi:hypothetical protein